MTCLYLSYPFLHALIHLLQMIRYLCEHYPYSRGATTCRYLISWPRETVARFIITDDLNSHLLQESWGLLVASLMLFSQTPPLSPKDVSEMRPAFYPILLVMSSVFSWIKLDNLPCSALNRRKIFLSDRSLNSQKIKKTPNNEYLFSMTRTSRNRYRHLYC